MIIKKDPSASASSLPQYTIDILSDSEKTGSHQCRCCGKGVVEGCCGKGVVGRVLWEGCCGKGVVGNNVPEIT